MLQHAFRFLAIAALRRSITLLGCALGALPLAGWALHTEPYAFDDLVTAAQSVEQVFAIYPAAAEDDNCSLEVGIIAAGQPETRTLDCLNAPKQVRYAVTAPAHATHCSAVYPEDGVFVEEYYLGDFYGDVSAPVTLLFLDPVQAVPEAANLSAQPGQRVSFVSEISGGQALVGNNAAYMSSSQLGASTSVQTNPTTATHTLTYDYLIPSDYTDGAIITDTISVAASPTACESGDQIDIPITITVHAEAAEVELTVYASTQGGVITSDPAGIDCGTQCSARFASETPITLNATPEAGYRFIAWSGACSDFGAEADCALILSEDTFVSAEFSPELSLTVELSGEGVVRSEDGVIFCPDNCRAEYQSATQIRLDAEPAAEWYFLGWGGACTGTDDCVLSVERALEVTANFEPMANRFQLDSPVNGSFESGLAVVSGWVCEADSIHIQFDDAPPSRVAYGAERIESLETCADTENGFAAAINWADYGDGEHVMTLIIDDEPVTQVAVTVTTFGAQFLRGLQATATVTDFPTAGAQTQLLWSEPHQNFLATHGDLADRASMQPAAQTTLYNLESPAIDGIESGRSLIRGWACDLASVEIALDHNPTRALVPYGSDRPDTSAVCGDIDNGFAIAINWNALTDGEHQLDLYFDGALMETRQFSVSTPAGSGTVSGIQRTYALNDFPVPGNQLELLWSEPHQNFRMISFDPRVPARAATAWRVAEIYVATLGYAPDAEGLAYWVNNIDTVEHWTALSVAQSFFDQPLVQALYPIDQPTEIFIDALYTNLFARVADDDGLAHWRAALESGQMQRNQMIISLIEGGWANPLAAADMTRFYYRVEVALAFAQAQAELAIQYSALSERQQRQLRALASELLAEITTDPASRDRALAAIAPRLAELISLP